MNHIILPGNGVNPPNSPQKIAVFCKACDWTHETADPAELEAVTAYHLANHHAEIWKKVQLMQLQAQVAMDKVVDFADTLFVTLPPVTLAKQYNDRIAFAKTGREFRAKKLAALEAGEGFEEPTG